MLCVFNSFALKKTKVYNFGLFECNRIKENCNRKRKLHAFISGNFAQLCDFIGKSAEILGKNASHLDNVLATLDVQQHSLGILGVL